MKLENAFQASLISKIKSRLPGSIVVKTASNYIQGFPDLLILHNNKWAALECKQKRNAKKQPNQDYYISKLDGMSFSRFIYPENEKEILDELQQSLES